MRVAVVHYEAAEGAALADRLRREGIDAAPYQHLGVKGFRELCANPPDAILIDLMRMPSYGRAIGALLRESKSLRSIPLVFLEGDPEKTARVRKLLPDAGFATLPKLPVVLRRCVRSQPAEPVVPVSRTSLAQKLKIREGASVVLVGVPEGFEDTLAPLPKGAHISRSGEGDLTLFFATSPAALSRGLLRFEATHGLWVLWRKRASGAGSFSLTQIHEACGALGLVAYKTCAVDQTWSAAAVSRLAAGARRRPAAELPPER